MATYLAVDLVAETTEPDLQLDRCEAWLAEAVQTEADQQLRQQRPRRGPELRLARCAGCTSLPRPSASPLLLEPSEPCPSGLGRLQHEWPGPRLLRRTWPWLLPQSVQRLVVGRDPLHSEWP